MDPTRYSMKDSFLSLTRSDIVFVLKNLKNAADRIAERFYCYSKNVRVVHIDAIAVHVYKL